MSLCGWMCMCLCVFICTVVSALVRVCVVCACVCTTVGCVSLHLAAGCHQVRKGIHSVTSMTKMIHHLQTAISH